MLYSSWTQFEDICPWSEVSPKTIEKPLQPIIQERKSAPVVKQSRIAETQNTQTDFKVHTESKIYRSRVRSIDYSKQLLKCTPVREFCDFKVTKELLMTKNSTLFPKQHVPRHFLQSQRRKLSQPLKKTSTSEFYTLNSALAFQVQKIEEQVKKNSRNKILGPKRLSNPKYQLFDPIF